MVAIVIPTLETTTFLTDPVDKIAYILRQFAAFPKSGSDTYYRETISLSDILSTHGHRQEHVVAPITDALMSVYTRIFGPGATTVNVTTEPLSGGRYNIVISVRAVENGTSYGLVGNIRVDDDGNLAFTVRTGT